jgi:beta-lactamase regulating signal transducer with metallopeptidase domain
MAAAGIHAITSFLVTLAGAAARSLVLGCVARAALALFAAKSVRVKLFVWKGVLLAGLAMPALMLVSPAVRVAVPMPSLPERTAAASAAPAESLVAEASPIVQLAPDTSRRSASRARRRTPSRPAPIVSQADLPTTAGPVPVSVPERRELPWMLIVFGIYAALVAALLVRVLVGIHFSNRLARFASSVDEPWALRALSAASRAAGLRSAPRLAESETLAVPVMVGVWKPTILLTPGWQEWDGDEFAAVLAHEISHVARRDALAQRLALIHRAIFWFSPLAWWLERRLADLAEQASDEAALAGGMDRTRYAEALLGFFAELEAGQERVWWQGVSMAKAGQAEKRVDRILAWRGAMSNKLTKSLVVALVVVAAPVVALTAAVRPVAYDVQAPAAPAAPPVPPAPEVDATPPSPAADPAQAQAPATPAAPAPPADAEGGSPEIHVVIRPLPPIPSIHVEVPAVNIDVPPVHVAIPQMRLETPALPAMPEQDVVLPPMTFSMSGDWNFYRGGQGGYFVGRYSDWGPRFVIVARDSDELTMSGDRNDAEHARTLKSKIPGDFIWFERDEKSYIISDTATVNRAKQLWQTNVDLEKQQKEFARQQEELAKQAEDARQKVEDMKIKVPDLSAEMQKVEEAMKQLSASGGTMDQIGDLLRQMGELQRQIGEAEAAAGRQQGSWGREQGDWGRKMGEIGRQQGEIGRKQAEAMREAARQMRQLLDDAVAKGLAKPE